MAAATNTVPPTTAQPDQQEVLDLSQKLPDTPMADQFTENPFDSIAAEPEADAENAHLVTHAKVYAIAEK